MSDKHMEERAKERKITIDEHGIRIAGDDPLTEADLDEALESWIVARTRLHQGFPFFGYLISKLRFVSDPWLQAPAATDSRRFIYNPNLMPLLEDADEVLFVTAHEVVHAAFCHPQRGFAKDPWIWNLAVDVVTNTLLEQTFGFCPDGLVRDVRGEFEGLSAEEVYAILFDRAQQQKKGSGPCPQCGGTGKVPQQESGGQGGEDGDGEGQGSDTDEQGQASDGSEEEDCPNCNGSGKSSEWWEDLLEQYGGQREIDDHGLWQEVPDSNSEDGREQQKEWGRAVSQAANIAKKRGHVPAGLERLIDDLIDVQLPWEVVLARYLKKKILSPKSTWARPNRRHLSRGVIMPGRAKVNSGNLLVGIDTSGSMSQEELRYGISSIFDLVKTIPGLTIHLVSIDAQIHEHVEKQPTDNADEFIHRACEAMKGGGGTRMKPLFDLAQEDVKPEAIVCITDGYNDWHEFTSPFPTVWLVTTEDLEAPWGITCHIDPRTMATKG